MDAISLSRLPTDGLTFAARYAAFTLAGLALSASCALSIAEMNFLRARWIMAMLQ